MDLKSSMLRMTLILRPRRSDEDQRLRYRPDRRPIGDQKKPNAAEFTIPHKRCKRQALPGPFDEPTADLGSLSNATSTL